MCKHENLMHTCIPGGGKGPCGSLASHDSQPLSSGFRKRLRLKKSDESNGGKHQCWPLTSTCLHLCKHMQKYVHNYSEKCFFCLYSQLSLPSSITCVPFLPVPSSWNWSLLWLGAQALGGGAGLYSLCIPVFQVLHWRWISGWCWVKQN